MAPKKPKIQSMEERKKLTAETLKGFGEHIYNQLSKGEFPSVTMASRSTTNIIYDEPTRQYVLGKRLVKRSARNIRHVRPFTQLIWAASFSNELCKTGKTSTLRDVYYSAQAFDINFADQQESDNIVTDIETVLGLAREDFHIFPEERRMRLQGPPPVDTVPSLAIRPSTGSGRTANLLSFKAPMSVRGEPVEP